ncbi:Glutathione S-transferase F12 [Linum perenne]
MLEPLSLFFCISILTRKKKQIQRGQLKMVVKVYGPLKAACPQRVMVCLLEKEVEFEVIPIDLDSGHQKLPDYVSKQPFGQVPYIEDGDVKLFGNPISPPPHLIIITIDIQHISKVPNGLYKSVSGRINLILS